MSEKSCRAPLQLPIWRDTSISSPAQRPQSTNQIKYPMCKSIYRLTACHRFSTSPLSFHSKKMKIGLTLFAVVAMALASFAPRSPELKACLTKCINDRDSCFQLQGLNRSWQPCRDKFESCNEQCYSPSTDIPEEPIPDITPDDTRACHDKCLEYLRYLIQGYPTSSSGVDEIFRRCEQKCIHPNSGS